MEKIKNLAEGFKLKYEKFIHGCDSVEEIKKWNKEENGEMEAYFSNELVSVATVLIAADGRFSCVEVEFLNELFDFDYTSDELSEIYEDYCESIEEIFDDGVENGISMLNNINYKLAESYKDLLSTLCEIIIKSDDVVENAEISLATELLEKMN